MSSKKKYEELTDLEKIQKQWHKLSGLHSRAEWSAAIVRAATAVEIAANYAVRKEFEDRSKFDKAFIDSLLRWANGLNGKLTHLLLPLSAGSQKKKDVMKKLRTITETINDQRNGIVHQGEFCNEQKARATIKQSREFITTLLRLYEPTFQLKDRKR
ncbi:MAG: hypothetical protein ABSD29_16430 [Verrucomicrobiota bacterium]|jgi:hypothetical protein